MNILQRKSAVTLLDMAIARAGLVSVPVYETDSAEQIEWILADARVRLVVTESVALAHAGTCRSYTEYHICISHCPYVFSLSQRF